MGFVRLKGLHQTAGREGRERCAKNTRNEKRLFRAFRETLAFFAFGFLG